MAGIRQNLLFRFSVASFAIVLVLALVIALVLRDGLHEHVRLLEGHARAMMTDSVSTAEHFSIERIRQQARELEQLCYVLVFGGFVVLYASLVSIVWGGWRTINRQEMRFRSVVEGLGEGVAVVEPDGRVGYVNRPLGEILDRRVDNLVGEHCQALIPRGTRMLDDGLADPETLPVERRLEQPDGTSRWLEIRATRMPVVGDGRAGTIYAVADISVRKQAEVQLQQAHEALRQKVAELEQANARLQHDAFHDALTGLPNRALFMDRLGHAVARWRQRRGRLCAVFYLNVDRFKFINDSLGHGFGDRLLVDVAGRLTAGVRALDTVARVGSDEFTILLEDVSSLEGATKVAESLREALQQPFEIDGHQLRISASIGIAMSTEGYEGPDDVLRAADIAMYHAKALGKGRFQVFDQAMYDQAMQKTILERDLAGAVARGEMEIHYFPVLDLAYGRLNGFEALVRWRHPRQGLVPPDHFIPLAEDSGMVVEIDQWVLRQACLQVKAWESTYGAEPPINLSVNMSAQHFLRPNLVAEVRQILEETGFDAQRLRLEITETVMVRQSEEVRNTLDRLRALGIELHLDDFGTGYSSLSYLHHVPADTLKIDRSFVDRMGTSPESLSLVQSILHIAGELGINVIAEGVETVQQLKQLQALQCSHAQGFLFSRPVPADLAEELIRDRKPFFGQQG